MIDVIVILITVMPHRKGWKLLKWSTYMASFETEEVYLMYAIVKTGGKQYKVAEGDVLFVEKLEGNAGDVVTLNEVLACTKMVS